MKRQVKYQLHVSIDAMDAAMKAVMGDKALPAYKTDWVELCDPMDEDEKRYAAITFPDKHHPELTMGLFLKLMCAALPLSRHPDTGFFVEAMADIDGKTAVSFSDSYQPRFAVNEYASNFWYEGKLFSEALQKKLNDIGKILREGNDNEY